jgi:putative flippase GtrA
VSEAGDVRVRKDGLARLRDIRFVRFLAAGAVNAVFGYSVFALLILLHLHYAVAAFFSTVCGVLFNFFVTTGRLVFGNRDPWRLFRFFGVYAVSYVVGVLLLRLSEILHINVLVAAAVLTVPMALFSYTLYRILVFREG